MTHGWHSAGKMFRAGKIPLITGLLAIGAIPPATGRERLKAVVFDFEFIDASLEGGVSS